MSSILMDPRSRFHWFFLGFKGFFLVLAGTNSKLANNYKNLLVYLTHNLHVYIPRLFGTMHAKHQS